MTLEILNSEHIWNNLPDAVRYLPIGCILVGGCVRDLLLGRSPADYDAVVTGDLSEAARDFARRSAQKVINLGNNRYRLLRVAGAGLQVDFVPLNGVDFAEDLRSRDFTINAMAFEPATRRFFDLCEGLRHLEQRLIVITHPDVFTDDALRLLRAFRFAGALEYTIDAATMTAIRAHVHLAAQPAAERILTEFTKLLEVPHATAQLRAMADSGVLFALFPELRDMKAHRANNFSDITAMEHTLRVVACLEGLLGNPGAILPAAALAQPEFRMVQNDPMVWFRLKLAALLHDVGKPLSRTQGTDGRVHYYGHENIGAATAEAVCRRLHCSNRDTLLVSRYIGAHMKALTMFNNHLQARRHVHKRAAFYLDHESLLPELFYIFLADALSKRDTLKPGYLEFIVDLALDYVDIYLPRRLRPLPLEGHKIRELLKPPAYMMSGILRELKLENIVREDFSEADARKIAKDAFYTLKSREKQTRK